MCRRTRYGLFAALFVALTAFPGCQSGGGSGLLHSSNFLSDLSFGNPAPAGQSEPDIVLHEEQSPRETGDSIEQ